MQSLLLAYAGLAAAAAASPPPPKEPSSFTASPHLVPECEGQCLLGVVKAQQAGVQGQWHLLDAHALPPARRASAQQAHKRLAAQPGDVHLAAAQYGIARGS